MIGHRLNDFVESDAVGCLRPNIARRSREICQQARTVLGVSRLSEQKAAFLLAIEAPFRLDFHGEGSVHGA